jgi:hypothetical protein
MTGGTVACAIGEVQGIAWAKIRLVEVGRKGNPRIAFGRNRTLVAVDIGPRID